MRVGVILPTFAASATPALEAARAAESEGIHGVFAYDHLWPLGEPGGPAIAPFPLLGAISTSTSDVAIGTLVARIGLTPDGVLIEELLTLDALSGGRVVAGLGTGDAKSAPENRAYGVPIASAAERRERCGEVARVLLDAGVTAWIGGGAPATRAVAREVGAVTNLWRGTTAEVAELASSGEVSWAGRLPSDRGAATTLLIELAAAGASWAVAIWPGSIAPLVEAASTAGISLG